ncbi:MAG: RNA polymerase sigma-70 factor [Tannerella sp.]|jgi:RNA polymerase sigma-70 factor (ECF subfamily)|nr:RNA polymerase sigma-70 factor [Tannerella sp.]
MLDDIIVFKKIKDGDIKAFECIFRRYYAPLCLYASGITGRTDVAEDMVQEVFYNIWKDRESIQVLQSVKSYLYGAVKNQSLRYMEHLQVHERYCESAGKENETSDEPSPQEQLEYAELEGIINRTLKKLPKRRRQIFRMHRLEGQKYKEIAGHFSISPKTVEAEMTKAYRVLQQEVEKYTQRRI